MQHLFKTAHKGIPWLSTTVGVDLIPGWELRSHKTYDEALKKKKIERKKKKKKTAHK